MEKREIMSTDSEQKDSSDVMFFLMMMLVQTGGRKTTMSDVAPRETIGALR